MDLNSMKYDKLRALIKEQFDKVGDWDSVKKLDYLPGNLDSLLTLFSSMYFDNKEVTVELWESLVELMRKRESETKVNKLGKEVKSDAKIPSDPNSAWQLYRKKLIDQNWSEESVNNIEKSSFSILQNLTMNTPEDGPVKGLVVGNVQSGKTANMAGLMSMAADNGFNYFIVLSGVIENLRKQTETRLYKDMTSSGKSFLHWNRVENPSIRHSGAGTNISSFNLAANDKDRYLTVCLKNKTRLNNLTKWLMSDENKAKQLKILIIDDEADQASVNTKKIEEEETTAINGVIKSLVNSNKFKGMNYIAYTATPYANVLNETSEDSLYPRDFIMLLEPSEDYIGPKEIFGIEEPEQSARIDILKNIPYGDVELMNAFQDNDDSQEELPKSFIEAIHWFLLSASALRSLDYGKPLTMLVHTSFKIADHQKVAEAIQDYLQYFKKNYEELVPLLKNQYVDATLDFKKSYFLKGMPRYTNQDRVADYPEWDEVKRNLDRLVRLDDSEYVSHIPIGEEGELKYHKGIHLAIDNSQATATDQVVRLVYPEKNQIPNISPLFIVVGGNTLSRGLTLEGLVTTYFLRKTNQADTLMQMGRWFGYRKGYEVFPRIWLDNSALERYIFLSQMNEEFREEIEQYATEGISPMNYAPKVKNSPNNKLIKVTSANKSQSAVPTDFNFAGFNSQTTYFDKDEDKLRNNLVNTKNFLNGLPKPSINKNLMVWNDIESSEILSFLKEYQVSSHEIKMSALPALITWAETNSINLDNWSVILSSIGDIKETKEGDWEIQGYYPKPVTRTKLKNRSTNETVNIGSLRNPTDLLADITENISDEDRNIVKSMELQKTRKKYGYGNTPQLLIYRIDKGNITEEEFIKLNTKKDGSISKEKRAPLNFPSDIIGINVMIPGSFEGNNAVTHISAVIDVSEQLVAEEEEE